MNATTFSAVGLLCAVCGQKIILATEGTGCGECGHPHHFDCACPPEPAVPPPPVRPAPTRETGIAYLMAGFGMTTFGTWVLVDLRMISKALDGVPVLIFMLPLIGSPKFLITGGYMAAQKVSKAGLSYIPRRTALWLAVAVNVSILLAAVFLFFAVRIYYPDFEIVK